MRTTTSPQPFENLREAFCQSRRCRPEKFAKKVFWRTLNRAALIPAILGGGARSEGYRKDLETIEAVGDARSVEEFERALEEFFTLNQLERDFWRGTIGMRVSGVRLARLFRPLAKGLRPPVVPPAASSAPTANGSSSDGAPASPQPVQQSAELDLVVLRKLRRVHEYVVGGALLNVAMREAGLEASRLEALLETYSVGRPELTWLQGYLLQLRELEQLRNDNARLTRLVADLTMQLNQHPVLHHAA
jgi:hypothetical protein